MEFSFSAFSQSTDYTDDAAEVDFYVPGLLANDEDVVNDLIGYLVLLKIGMNDERNRQLLEMGKAIYGDGLKADLDPETFEAGFKTITIPLHRRAIPQEDDNGV